MKKYFFMAMATLVVSAAAVVGVKAYNYYSMPELMRANLEALCNDGENNQLIRNFKSAEVWILTKISGEIEISYTKPSWTFMGTYENIVCCVNGTDMGGCDFSLENPKCAQYVVRNAH